MANSTALFGFRAVKSEGGPSRVNYYTLSSASAQVYEGDIVEISGGLVIKSTAATPTPLGVAAQASGTITAQNTRFAVYDDPDCIYMAKAATAVTITSVGLRCAIANFSATGLSGVSVESVDVGTQSTSYPVLILGLVDRPDNASGNNADIFVKLKSTLKS